MVGLATLAVTLIGLLGPKLNNILFSNVIKSNDMRLFLGVTVMLAATAIAGVLIGTVKSIVMERLQTKTGTAVQAANDRLIRAYRDLKDEFEKVKDARRVSYKQAVAALVALEKSEPAKETIRAARQLRDLGVRVPVFATLGGSA
jgi:microsomal dipeptidase-like Zn-dependent dipeptidase